MTNNLDRAIEVIGEAYQEAMDSGTPSTWRYQIAQALSAAGLLDPDLPRPDRDGRWWPTAASIGNVNINPAGEIVLHSGNFRDMTLHLTPAKARDLANILNAAANHAEKDTSE